MKGILLLVRADFLRILQFEIKVSQIDRGASLGWCSQYPNEEEVLMPPLSNLEVTGEKMIVYNGRPIRLFDEAQCQSQDREA